MLTQSYWFRKNNKTFRNCKDTGVENDIWLCKELKKYFIQTTKIFVRCLLFQDS